MSAKQLQNELAGLGGAELSPLTKSAPPKTRRSTWIATALGILRRLTVGPRRHFYSPAEAARFAAEVSERKVQARHQNYGRWVL